MNPLLKNAVVSIQLGLEDFASEDERRVISAARNLYSGVLLLAKEVLRQLSPSGSNDILIRIKKKAVKGADGTIRFVGDGKKTIDRLEIEETFKHKPLLGLYKKHFTSPRFLVKNLANFTHSKLGRKHFQKIWDEAARASSTGIITTSLAFSFIVIQVTIGWIIPGKPA